MLNLRESGAVSRLERKSATKVYKYGRKNPWVPTLTELFPKIQADAGSWLGTKNALYYCAQSANSFSWVLLVLFRPYLKTFVAPFLPTRRTAPWVSEDGGCSAKLLLAWVSGVSGEKGKNGSEKGREVKERKIKSIGAVGYPRGYLNTWLPRSIFIYSNNTLLTAGCCKSELRYLKQWYRLLCPGPVKPILGHSFGRRWYMRLFLTSSTCFL